MVDWSWQVESSPAGNIKPSGRCDLVPISLRILRLNSASTTLHFTWDASQGLEAAKEFVEVICRENNASGGEIAYVQYAESIMQQAQASGPFAKPTLTDDYHTVTITTDSFQIASAEFWLMILLAPLLCRRS